MTTKKKKIKVASKQTHIRIFKSDKEWLNRLMRVNRIRSQAQAFRKIRKKISKK